MRLLNKLILVFIFLTLLLGIFGYWQWQRHIFSEEVVRLEIFGPREVEAGEEFEYLVKFKNKGVVRLEEVRLIFEYPRQAIVPDGKPLWQEIILEDINPGQEKTIPFRARLLGREGEKLVARAALSYRPKNLQARFESVTTFTTIIESVPLTFEFEMPPRIAPGRNFTFRINYFSHLDDYPLTNLRIQIEYPPNFKFISSVPRALGRNEWPIPVLNPFQGGRIEISGQLLGEDNQPKIFRARLGILREGEFILLRETRKAIEITRPAIHLRQKINRNPDHVASAGEWLYYEIYFKNLDDRPLTNLSMVIRLEGEAFDFQTISSDLGQTRPELNSVVFDWGRVSKLQFLLPMEEGKVDFWVRLRDDFGPVTNPVLKSTISIDGVEEEFVTKVNSRLEIVQRGYFQDEVFGNRGPIPPRVGETTTYTIVWQAKNYYSLVRNVKVKAILPPAVELTRKIFPEEEALKFTFDPETRKIVWLVGDLETRTDVFAPPRSLAFQIAFTPNEFLRGAITEIIGKAKITGEDSWTGQTLKATALNLNTTLPDDETITEEMGIVQ